MDWSKPTPKVRGVAMATPAVAVRPGAAPKMKPTITPMADHRKTFSVKRAERPARMSFRDANSMAYPQKSVGKSTVKPWRKSPYISAVVSAGTRTK